MPAARKSLPEEGPMDWKKFLLDAGRYWGVPTVLIVVGIWFMVFEVWPVSKELVTKYVTANAETQRALVETQRASAETEKQMAESMESLAVSQKALADSQERMATSHVQLVGMIEGVKSATEEIVETERESQVFMQGVQEHHQNSDEMHQSHDEKLEKILDAVEDDGEVE